jgi:Ca2+-binding RTX toxin-like protein
VFSDAGFNLGLDEGKGTATPQKLAASVFSTRTNGTMATKADRFAYNAGTGALFYDPDGSGTRSAATQVASLLHDPHISVADLFFIR